MIIKYIDLVDEAWNPFLFVLKQMGIKLCSLSMTMNYIVAYKIYHITCYLMIKIKSSVICMCSILPQVVEWSYWLLLLSSQNKLHSGLNQQLLSILFKIWSLLMFHYIGLDHVSLGFLNGFCLIGCTMEGIFPKSSCMGYDIYSFLRKLGSLYLSILASHLF